MSNPESIQLFPALDLATEAALRASIERWGVLQPVVVDQHGRILDGNHRSRIANDLGVAYDTRTVTVADDDDAHDVARTLNLDRRHLDADDRRRMVAMLRQDGHSLRSIGRALGVDAATVHRDVESAGVAAATPAEVRGADGKRYPARRPQPATPAEVIDRATDDEPGLLEHLDELEANVADATIDTEPERQVEAAEAAVEETCRHLAERDEPARPAISKPDLGAGISHPARYSRPLIPLFAKLLRTYANGPRVLDPFAGAGGIHDLRDHGYDTTGVELEPEWANLHEHTAVGDATDLPFPDEEFDAVVTSPAYGNRLADSYNSSDPHLRRSYRFDLGRELSDGNAGAMQWGDAYRQLHLDAWAEAKRVLRPGGVLLLNIKDHYRNYFRQPVAGWHVTALCRLGFTLLEHTTDFAQQCDTCDADLLDQAVGASSLRQGANSGLRLAEQVYVLRKDEQ